MPKKRIPKDRLHKVFEPMRVKYKDIFSLRNFYKSFREYLLEYNWMDVEDKTEHWESYYYERIDRKGAKEIWIRWRCYKPAQEGAGINFYLDFDWHCVALTDAEVIKNGNKVKVNKGEVEIYFKAYIEEAYKIGFAKNPFLSQIKSLFSKRLYHHQLEQRKKELYQEAYAMQNWMKQWFKMKRYLPYEESRSFFKSYAWPSHLKEE